MQGMNLNIISFQDPGFMTQKGQGGMADGRYPVLRAVCQIDINEHENDQIRAFPREKWYNDGEAESGGSFADLIRIYHLRDQASDRK